MPVVKFSIFQKNIHTKITQEEITKLVGQKSQFLLLPESYPSFFRSSSIASQVSQEKQYTDHLHEISEAYQGVIVGGSLYRKAETENKFWKSLPLTTGMSIADFYDKRSPNAEEKESGVERGSSESIFIIGSLRFGVLLGEDLLDESNLDIFQKESVEVVFHCGLRPLYPNYETHLQSLDAIARARKLHIVSVGGISKACFGWSLYATPTGIHWKTGKVEEEKEIIKTLSLSLSSGIF